jgi:hypothetical protein
MARTACDGLQRFLLYFDMAKSSAMKRTSRFHRRLFEAEPLTASVEVSILSCAAPVSSETLPGLILSACAQ